MDAPERYVHRISNASFDGWRLQITGFGLTEWFSVARHGSEAAARAAAIARRDEIFPLGVPAGRAFCATRRPEGGLVGVVLAINRRPARIGGQPTVSTVYWMAMWGTHGRKRYSVKTLGWEAAFRAACVERRAHTGYPVDPDLATVPDIPADVEAWLKAMASVPS